MTRTQLLRKRLLLGARLVAGLVALLLIFLVTDLATKGAGAAFSPESLMFFGRWFLIALAIYIGYAALTWLAIFVFGVTYRNARK